MWSIFVITKIALLSKTCATYLPIEKNEGQYIMCSCSRENIVIKIVTHKMSSLLGKEYVTWIKIQGGKIECEQPISI